MLGERSARDQPTVGQPADRGGESLRTWPDCRWRRLAFRA
ncbi:hypothetical protein KPATCC21470_2471 [Kitasatospora purpeofusca]